MNRIPKDKTQIMLDLDYKKVNSCPRNLSLYTHESVVVGRFLAPPQIAFPTLWCYLVYERELQLEDVSRKDLSSHPDKRQTEEEMKRELSYHDNIEWIYRNAGTSTEKQIKDIILKTKRGTLLFPEDFNKPPAASCPPKKAMSSHHSS